MTKQRTAVQDTYVCMIYMNRAMSGISICKGAEGRKKEHGPKRGGREARVEYVPEKK